MPSSMFPAMNTAPNPQFNMTLSTGLNAGVSNGQPSVEKVMQPKDSAKRSAKGQSKPDKTDQPYQPSEPSMNGSQTSFNKGMDRSESGKLGNQLPDLNAQAAMELRNTKGDNLFNPPNPNASITNFNSGVNV